MSVIAAVRPKTLFVLLSYLAIDVLAMHLPVRG
jgi:hypothetical protein